VERKNGTDAEMFAVRRAEVRAVPCADLRAVVCAEGHAYSRAVVCAEPFTEIIAPMQKLFQIPAQSTKALITAKIER
jgi:hypothetical protein